MEEFLARHRNLSILLLVLLGQLVLLGYQVKRNEDVRLLRVWTVAIIAPIEKALHEVSSFVASSWKEYVWLIDARRENQQLRRELDRLKLEHQQLRRALARFEREEDLLAYQKEISSQTVLAQVIGVGANPNSKEVFLDKGLDAGIKPGMAVVTPDGIVGKVLASHRGASLVQLLDDSEAGVGVMLAGSRVHGVMKPSGSDQCRIDYVGHEVDVQIGEKVYTSGDDRIYPKGLPVGEVVRLERGRDFQEISVKPFVALNRLDEVLVITFGVHQEIPPFPAPQASEVLIAAPPTPKQPGSRPLAISAPEGEVGTGTEANGPEPYVPQTDADRLKEHYQAVGAAQGHRFGEGLPGSRPPDFNLGLTPPSEAVPGEQGRRPPPSAPSSQDVSAPGVPSGASTTPALEAESRPQAEHSLAPGSPPQEAGGETQGDTSSTSPAAPGSAPAASPQPASDP